MRERLRRWLLAALALVYMSLMMGCAARPESGFLATTAYERPAPPSTRF
ncbi:MAG: hypothetical protein WDN29_15495 [Methylovirgula sp.]